MEQQSRQRVAAHGGNPSGPPERSRARDPIWQHGKAQMGRELGVHGPVRLRVCAHLLGFMGTPHGVRGQAFTLCGSAQPCLGREVSPRKVNNWVFSNG